ncbi:MAG: 3-dehydroquinate synthase [Kiritimatiellia bacterium]|jgi:3-dehydroquinate synthase|nr:3-dehydroquinate synthase [Kiritimatiellia bacterium]
MISTRKTSSSGCVHLQTIVVQHTFPVVFTRHLFSPRNRVLRDALTRDPFPHRRRALVLIDKGVLAAFPELRQQIRTYFNAHAEALQLVRTPLALTGGETIKQSAAPVKRMIDALRAGNICRHSYCLAIGGGAFLDAAGLAAALFHRGVRLVRIPTTALAQCDSGVGVKNAINYDEAKNLLGTFAPPSAVLNDSDFLESLPLPLLLDGIAEAVKVAAIKDLAFFRAIERAAPKIACGDLPTIQRLLKRCALLHLDHIATSGDPFELGTARPLDYGHWAAHKLEAMTKHRLSHGHAVAIGIALDALYGACLGLLPETQARRLIDTLRTCGLPVFTPELAQMDRRGRLTVLDGLEDFRAHLGGELTITFPAPLGARIELHSIDETLMADCIAALGEWE